MPPIDIMADEMKRLDVLRRQNLLNAATRKRERQFSIAQWQRRWSESGNGRWIHRLIPELESWLNRDHGETSYQLTRFLTGHVGYRKYLHRFGHDDSPLCPCCSAPEDAEYVMFSCPRFHGIAPCVEEVIGFMCESQRNWQSISATVTEIQLEFRRIERTRRSGQQS